MSMEIQLIHQIEKYEFLYNFHLPEYNRKDLVEDAWANIAASTNLSISDCKEKWRNIRSSFLRSMKHSGSKVKKPYYLTDYLTFILPYLKPIQIESTDDSHFETQSNIVQTDTGVAVDFIKAEPGDHDGNIENNAENGILSDLLTRRSPVVVRRRRRFIPAGRRNLTEVNKHRNKVTSTYQRNDVTNSDVGNSTNNSAMRMFLMSLLPELETMNEEQIRLFKIKSMILIDDIKSNYAQMRRNTSGADGERLQKRLINLLLKSLEQRTAIKTKEESFSDCKEKWRNIRSSFLRSMKHSGSKVKKPYYLTDYLTFILPYLKPIQIESTDDSHFETQSNIVQTDTGVAVDFIKAEPGDHDGNIENNAENGILSDLLTRRSPVVVRRRRRFIPAGRRNLTEVNKHRNKVTSTYQRNDVTNSDVGNSTNNSAMRMFLMSLLPELETMNEEQIRLFKIKSMILIDDIKSNYAQMRRNTSGADGERLQKRLINLLLKSLEQRTAIKTKEESCN